MELKPGYKQTEVGVIPEDWDVVLLDSVARRASGHTPDKTHPEYWGGDIKWVSLADSQRLDNLYISETAATITPEGIANSSANLLPAGSCIVSRDAGVGKSAILAEPMAVSQHFMAWNCGPRLSNHYLYFLLQAMKPELERIAIGNTIKTIGLPYFKALRIQLPSIEEQNSIASALTDIDQFIRRLERSIAKKQGIKQAAMHELLTGKRRLPGFEGEWEVKRLGDVGEIKSGGTPSTSQRAFWDGGVPWCTPTDITALDGRKYLTTTARTISSSGLQASSAEIIPPQSLIMTTRATIGECAINTLPMTTNQGFKNMVPSPVVGIEFLYYLMSTQKQRLISLCGGSTFLEIGKKELSAYEIRLPLDRLEQDAISSTLSAIDDELQALEASLGKAENLKQGMMQQLLTGKIRLT